MFKSNGSINAPIEFQKVIDCHNKNLGCSAYTCPKCKYNFEAPIKAVLVFEEDDEWNGLPIKTPPYIICVKCKIINLKENITTFIKKNNFYFCVPNKRDINILHFCFTSISLLLV